MKIVHEKLRWIGFLSFITVMLVIVCGLTAGGYSPILWQFAPRQQIRILIPEGHEGPVLIAYQIPDGVFAERQGDTLIYRMPPDGALFLRDDPYAFIESTTFWYDNKNGDLRYIPPSTCFANAPQTEVVVCTGMSTGTWKMKDFRPNRSYFVTRPVDKERRVSELDALLDRYQARLAINP